MCLKENILKEEEKARESIHMIGQSPKHKKGISTLLDITQGKIKSQTKAEDYNNDNGKISTNESQPSFGSRRRYPKRNIKKQNYVEIEDIEDELLYCDECRRSYEGDCPVHGQMLFIPDTKVKSGSGPNYAKMTCPPCLSVCNARRRGAGLGIWTEITLPKGTVFGPYKGTIIKDRKDAAKSGYAWQVKRGGRIQCYIEGKDPSISNWMRFVNCADSKECRNLVAYQYKGEIYYRTIKEVKPFTELMVWYGDEYARNLGIDMKEINKKEQKGAVEGYECDVCHMLFASEDYLSRHKKIHPLTCSFVKHFRRMHTKKRLYTCKQCGRKLSSLNSLRRHSYVHSGETPFKCKDCGKKFSDSSHLRRHEIIHAGNPPFVCTTCGRRFCRKETLDQHKLIHTGQKPHKCPHCGYRSAQLGNFQSHVRRMHAKEYIYICSRCGKRFVKSSLLLRHRRMAHY